MRGMVLADASDKLDAVHTRHVAIGHYQIKLVSFSNELPGAER
jgi:hypothetical protein